MPKKVMDPAREESFARFCAETLQDKLAEEVTVLAVRDLSSIADYFIIATANSQPHLKALASHLERQARDQFAVRPLAVDGEPASEWVLLDFGAVLVHLMSEETRRRYDLERLWADAPRLTLSATGR